MDTSTAVEASSPTFSSSSSCSFDDETYDVFLSFRGEDTRKTFTDHLYWRLKHARVDVFIDENELRGGEIIPDELNQIIQRSRISVIIFSRRYADSIWCLEELEKIMECRRKLGQIVLPIFYDVDPSDVREQTGSFAEAFQTHEVRFHGVKDKEEKIQSWRKSLTEAADLDGLVFSKIDGYEGVFIRKIIDEINRKLKSTCLGIATKQVGIESSKQEISNYVQVQVGIDSRLQDISTHLDVGGSNDVRIIGIWGMGGMGKSTVAEAIFNKYHPSFDAKSFIQNMRERKLVDLQEQLLLDIFKPTKVKGSSMDDRMYEIKKRLPTRKVLVILDDICHADQLKALAIEHDSFGLGSRIVITTRNKHLLEIIEVDKICCLKAMNDVEALELLSWHAFKSRCPNEGYLELSREVVGYCGGLPLALKVLGSSLYNRSTIEWGNALDKWKTLPPKEIHEKLKLSYEGLIDDQVKAIFLDISCFFIGMNKDYVKTILDGCDFDTEIGIRELHDQCLVSVDEGNNLIMHGLLRDMGREIVREESPIIIGKRSRLWNPEDVTDVLRNESGTSEIEGVTLDLQGSHEPSFSAEALKNMQELRLLKLQGVKFTGDCKGLSKKLRLLCWPEFPLEAIPEDFNQPNIVDLDLRNSQIQVWKDSDMPLEKLKFLNLGFCDCLKQSPDFSKLPNLVELTLEGCQSLSEIHHSILQLKTLKYLCLAYCNLTDEAIPEDLGDLSSLAVLDLTNNDFNKLPTLSGLSKLQTLQLDNCSNLTAIPDLPAKLEILQADECIALEEMPNFSEMLCMIELHMNHSPKLTEIPGLDKSLESMTIIHMERCTNLTADFRNNILQGWTSCGYGGIFLNGNDIPDWFHCVHDNAIVYFIVPQSVGHNLKGLTLSFVCSSDSFYNSSAFSIRIKNMTEGTELDAKIIPDCAIEGYYLWQGQLSNVELKLQDGDKVLIEIIPEYVWGDVKVKKTGVSLVWDKFMNENMIDYHLCAYERRPSQNLVNDDDMNLCAYDMNLCAYERHPSQNLVNDDDIIHVEDDNHITKSPDFSKFPNLEKLILKDCVNLSKVHSSIGDLGRLSLVNLEGCYMLEDLPLNFYKSKSIEILILNGCWRFEKLGDGLGDMVSLTILQADTTHIRQIPSSIVKLKKLRILSLSGCRLTADSIPKDLCSLISLEDLLLGGNDFRRLPILAGLSKLKVLCVNACKNLRAIPDLPTSLYVLKANDCPKLEKIPDFSNMWKMRELYLSDSFRLTEVPGLDKSLNSMTRIHMEGCTNLTADFRNNILQRWTSCGFGGIYLNGNYDIPEWFKFVNDVGNFVCFEVPQRIMGRDLKGLTICFVYSSDRPKLEDSQGPIGIIVRNLTKQTALHTKIAFASLKSSSEPEEPEDDSGEPDEPEDDYLWQGQLSNDVLRLEGGDHVSILVRPDDVDFVRVKKTGVHLEWDKVMKENMDNPDPHLYDWETNGDFSRGVDDSISRNRENKGRKSKRRRIGSFDYV